MNIKWKEIWRKITNYPNYKISNWGNCKRKEILKIDLRKGYAYVVLYNNGIPKKYSIHRLVAETFIENIDNKYSVDHIDRNILNNHVSNLRWATMEEQCKNKTNRGVGNTNEKYITFDKKYNRFRVNIRKCGKLLFSNSYLSLDSAIKNRDLHELLYI